MRKRIDGLSDFAHLGMRLDWRLTALLAVSSYGALHYLANLSLVATTELSQVGKSVVLQVVRVSAGFLQYLVPAFLLLGAIAGMAQRRRGRSLLKRAATDPQSLIHTMSWQDFERLVGASFERSGFTVERTGGAGPDGGVDLVLHKGRDRTVVQCKQWRARRVGVAVVRELYGIMAAQGAVRGIIVSAGEFTPAASEFANGRNIQLLTGHALSKILATAEPSAILPVSAFPSCPMCGSSMMKRTDRRGPKIGRTFWGCETYPRCRGAVSI